MKSLFFILIVISVASLTNANTKNKKSKSVTTLLEAKWGATPLVLEVAEYLVDENVDFYWNYVDSICNLSPPISEISKINNYDFF